MTTSALMDLVRGGAVIAQFCSLVYMLAVFGAATAAVYSGKPARRQRALDVLRLLLRARAEVKSSE
ncbi:hypothetical protein ACQPZF_27250 [Actinosynnema sp. CS-041913]|uniref:hypothetical protein n=1 Tax=Actinosynnema sp. CS-041913 TaxID=3239917 RepID=UPI003D8E0F36